MNKRRAARRYVATDTRDGPAPLFRGTRPCRRHAAALCWLLALFLSFHNCVQAANPASTPHVLRQVYLSGVARIARGDPGGAVSAFKVVNEFAPDLPEAQYSLALSMVLADFSRREQALPLLRAALARDPEQPLYNILEVLADPAETRLLRDGALYFTPAGSRILTLYVPKLVSARECYNGRYLKTTLTTLQQTENPAYPLRLADFRSMIGAKGMIRLMQFPETPFAFGRLFVVSIPESRFDPYEAGFLARLFPESAPVADTPRERKPE
jgi:hypothetical protein